MIDIFQADPRRSSLHGGWRGGLSGADFGLRLGGQDEFELIEQEREFGFWFGVAGQQQLSAVGRRDMQINHLHGGELFDGAARREARRQGMEAPAECDMEAIGEEGDEDMRLDANTDELSQIKVARLERSGDISFIKANGSKQQAT